VNKQIFAYILYVSCPISITPTYLLTYSLTHLLTPCSRVLLGNLTGLQLVKKFPCISRNPKFYYRTHKRPPPVSILRQPNPVHIPTSHLLEIHPNIISGTYFHTSLRAEQFPLERILPRRSDWQSSLPLYCFISRISILHVNVSNHKCFTGWGC